MMRHLLPSCTVLLLTSTPGVGQTVEQYIAQGDSLLATNKHARALDAYSKAVALSPSATTYAARARAWYAMDRADRLQDDIDRALKLDSLNPDANYQRSMYALRGEDYRAAARFSDRGIRYGATGRLRAQLLLARGEAFAELKRPEEAARDLREGLAIIPDNLEANRTLARVLDELGEHDEALVVLERLCDLEPKNPGHWVNRGFELSLLGRWEDALAMYDKALGIDRDEPVALSNRASALMNLGRNDEALKDVDRSLRYYPANAYALRTRALLRLRKGLLEKACADLSLARILGGVEDVDALIQEHCSSVPERR